MTTETRCAASGAWLLRAVMSAIFCRRLKRRRWFGVSIAASASSPQLNTGPRPSGSGAVISFIVTTPGPIMPRPPTAI